MIRAVFPSSSVITAHRHDSNDSNDSNDSSRIRPIHLSSLQLSSINLASCDMF